MHERNRCRKLCHCSHSNCHRLSVHMELHKNSHRLGGSQNAEMPYAGCSGENSRDRKYYIRACLLCFVLQSPRRLTTSLHVLHSDDYKNSSAVIYGTDHIFHKLQMTISGHVLMNKSHRFCIFPLKQNKNKNHLITISVPF